MIPVGRTTGISKEMPRRSGASRLTKGPGMEAGAEGDQGDTAPGAAGGGEGELGGPAGLFSQLPMSP